MHETGTAQLHERLMMMMMMMILKSIISIYSQKYPSTSLVLREISDLLTSFSKIIQNLKTTQLDFSGHKICVL